MNRIILFLVILLIILVRIARADEISEGKSVAENHCSRCHVIGDFNPNGGISSTPSFQLMVNALNDFEERFDTFYARPPHPAVIIVEGIEKLDELPFNAAPVRVSIKDIKNISAFAKTLKKK